VKKEIAQQQNVRPLSIFRQPNKMAVYSELVTKHQLWM